MRAKLNKQVDGKWGAAVVACADLVALGAFFSNVDLDQFRWTWTAVAFVAFFPVALIGLIALAYGAKGKQVTSEETDKKIAEAWVSFRNAVRWPLLFGFLLYLSYLVWQVHLELHTTHNPVLKFASFGRWDAPSARSLALRYDKKVISNGIN